MKSEGSVGRALAVLEYLVMSPTDTSVQQLAEELDMPTSTAHRVLSSLREANVAQHDPHTRRYSPGPLMLRLASVLHDRVSADSVVEPILRSVVADCNENAQYGRLLADDLTLMFTRQVQSSHSLRFNAAMFQPSPLIWGCSGRVVLAQLSEDQQKRAWETSPPTAPGSGRERPTWSSLAETCQQIVEQGWDHTAGEKLAESVGYAAPVRGAKGVLGSISLTIPAHRYQESRRDAYIDIVTEAARDASYALGQS